MKPEHPGGVHRGPQDDRLRRGPFPGAEPEGAGRISRWSARASAAGAVQDPNINQQNDIYAFGATLYRMLTGENLERYKFEIPPVRTLRSDVHPFLEKLLWSLPHAQGR